MMQPPMQPLLLSSGLSGLAVVLSLWFLIGTWTNQSVQRSLQNQQDDIQARQTAIQGQQQILQAQQQQIESAAQLANQVGPAIIRDLAALQIQSKNSKIEALLKKYGIEAKPNP